MSFSWIPIYMELAREVLKYRDRQDELLKMLQVMKDQGLPVIRLLDSDANGNDIPLSVMEPFTFFASFNRGINNENRKAILLYIKQALGLHEEVPSDFDGIPIADNRSSWFFSWFYKRRKQDVNLLWDMAQAAITKKVREIEPDIFNNCLKIHGVSQRNLSMGCFWFNPEEFLSLDKINFKYCHLKFNLRLKASDYKSYIQLLEDVRETTKESFPKISYDAWQNAKTHSPEKVEKKQYWAGGIEWSIGSQKDKFLSGNYWQTNWGHDDESQGARDTWKRFDQIQIGDEFAIKGYGGEHVLKVYYIGKVVEKIPEEGKLILEQIMDRKLYHGKAPRGKGAGNWRDTIVPVTKPDIIKKIFHPDETVEEVELTDSQIDVQEPIDLPLNLILYGPPGTGKTFMLQNEFMPRFPGRWEFITFHQSYSYEEFVEGIRPLVKTENGCDVIFYDVVSGVFKKIAERAMKQPEHKFAIFIDEINRANISKVFGELITLLEPDKRMKYEKDEWTGGIKLKLPYTHAQNPNDPLFGVPDNLHVIGTMNTADRSIALMDSALRRRFEFLEFIPEPNIINEAGHHLIREGDVEIDLVKLLTTMNRRIEILYDRDHTIGHSYFLGIQNYKELEHRILTQIIPLLQEYFYGDWEKVQIVLADLDPEKQDENGQPGIRENAIIKRKDIPKNDYLARIRCDELEVQALYELPKNIAPASILKIYEE